jgi:hypothetical protein
MMLGRTTAALAALLLLSAAAAGAVAGAASGGAPAAQVNVTLYAEALCPYWCVWRHCCAATRFV